MACLRTGASRGASPLRQVRPANGCQQCVAGAPSAPEKLGRPLPQATKHRYVTASSEAVMDQYEDDEENRARVLSNGQVLAFIAGYWNRRRWRAYATVACTLAAIGFE